MRLIKPNNYVAHLFFKYFILEVRNNHHTTLKENTIRIRLSRLLSWSDFETKHLHKADATHVSLVSLNFILSIDPFERAFMDITFKVSLFKFSYGLRQRKPVWRRINNTNSDYTGQALQRDEKKNSVQVLLSYTIWPECKIDENKNQNNNFLREAYVNRWWWSTESKVEFLHSNYRHIAKMLHRKWVISPRTQLKNFRDWRLK